MNLRKDLVSEPLGRSAGFTGTRHPITSFQRANLLLVLSVTAPEEGHYGDCTGADYEFFMMTRALRIYVVSHPGLDESQRMFSLADEIREPKDNLERNIDIVSESDYLIACPRETSEVRRSGTWMTVRAARTLGRTVLLILPDGRVDIQRQAW